MIAVLFELEPQDGAQQRYFDLAAELKGSLQALDGFLSIERFESLSRPGRYLSLSYWRDEEAVRRWRTQAEHRAAQREGRGSVFKNYRLRVATVIRDYGMHDRAQAPPDSLNALS